MLRPGGLARSGDAAEEVAGGAALARDAGREGRQPSAQKGRTLAGVQEQVHFPLPKGLKLDP